MRERTNRRDQIVDAASQLFIENGYDGTSVRQIAESVGCTEAALYYHFRDGKRELLQAVIGCQIPDLLHTVEASENAPTLYEFIKSYGHHLAQLGPQRLERMRWISTEFPRMTPEERSMFHHKHMALQNRMAAAVERYVQNPEQARVIGATIICTLFGYGFLFNTLDIQSVSPVSGEAILEQLARSFSTG